MSAEKTETWIAWMDGHRQAGANALGVEVCEELNVTRKD